MYTMVSVYCYKVSPIKQDTHELLTYSLVKTRLKSSHTRPLPPPRNISCTRLSHRIFSACQPTALCCHSKIFCITFYTDNQLLWISSFSQAMYIVVFLNSEFRKNNPKCAQTIVRRVCCEGHCITLFGKFNQNLCHFMLLTISFSCTLKKKDRKAGDETKWWAWTVNSYTWRLYFPEDFWQRFEAGNAVSNFETVDRFANKPFKNTLIKGSICFFVLQNCLNFGSQHYWEWKALADY